jgi:hypothetical protein
MIRGTGSRVSAHSSTKPERRRKNLIQLGTLPTDARRFAYTRKGGWAVAQSPIMLVPITLKRLEQRGYESLESFYQKVKGIPFPGEPPYIPPLAGQAVTRPACPVRMRRVRWRETCPTAGGGAPHKRQLVGPSTRLVAGFFLSVFYSFKNGSILVHTA